MKIQFSAFVLLVASLPLSSAWGNMGHETVAYVAANFGIHLILKALVRSLMQIYSQECDSNVLPKHPRRYVYRLPRECCYICKTTNV
jgi:hypothetical protein